MRAREVPPPPILVIPRVDGLLISEDGQERVKPMTARQMIELGVRLIQCGTERAGYEGLK